MLWLRQTDPDLLHLRNVVNKERINYRIEIVFVFVFVLCSY